MGVTNGRATCAPTYHHDDCGMMYYVGICALIATCYTHFSKRALVGMGRDSVRVLNNKKKKEEEDARKYHADGFSYVVGNRMYAFNKDHDNKEIEIKEPIDFGKIFVIFMQVKTLITTVYDGGGAIPQLSRPQLELFDGVLIASRKGEKEVDLLKLSSLSTEDITAMISAQNKVCNGEKGNTP
ncbi:hypothetical protein [Staphylococcus phage vB_SauH_DELF3]|nr:hypothetical protein [Staphylococcus phage vB_SauH_DELF3]